MKTKCVKCGTPIDTNVFDGVCSNCGLEFMNYKFTFLHKLSAEEEAIIISLCEKPYNEKTILSELKNGAENGSASAQYELSRRYNSGIGVAVDLKLAKQYCVAAKEQGNKAASDLLSEINMKIELSKTLEAARVKQETKAKEEAKAVAEAKAEEKERQRKISDAIAEQERMAERARKKKEEEQARIAEENRKKQIAKEKRQAAARRKKEEEKAAQLRELEERRAAALNGDVNAQLSMGNRYYLGTGVSVDYREAVRWYSMAANQGNLYAQRQLAIFYDNGMGVERNLKEARKWYRMAARQGDESAREWLRVQKGIRSRGTMPEWLTVFLWTCGVVVAVVAIMSSYTYLVPKININKAEKFLDEGNFSEAYTYYMKESNTVYADEILPQAKALEYGIQKNALKTASIGDSVLFGSYMSEKNGEYKQLSWRVLAEQKGKLLLFCDTGVAAMAYMQNGGISNWENSGVREWLNGFFFDTAFTEEAHNIICETTVDNQVWDAVNNKLVDAAPTTDKLFLLNVAEVEGYLTIEDRKRSATAFAKKSGAEDNNGFVQYWLRTPGQFETIQSYVARDGTINPVGNQNNLTGKCVCPAIWIDTTKIDHQ